MDFEIMIPIFFYLNATKSSTFQLTFSNVSGEFSLWSSNSLHTLENISLCDVIKCGNHPLYR